MSDFVMQIGADLDLSKVQEQLDSIKKQKVTLDIDIKVMMMHTIWQRALKKD